MSRVWMLQRGHSGDGCVLASTLCKYDLRKGDLFVLNWARVRRVRRGSLSSELQVQLSFFSERLTYQNIMVLIRFAIQIAQRTYISAIQVNVLIYWSYATCTSIFC